jgi:hypothetical protein
MKRRIVAMAVVAVLMTVTSAMATPLATYTHNYGNGVGQVDPGGQDPLSAGYVTVKDTATSTGYQRFNDTFDFSSLNYASINHFDLTLTYSGVGSYLFGLGERWSARPGGTSNYTSFALNPSNGTVSQTFVIDSSLSPEFNQMVAAKNFFFWFAEDTIMSDEFKLNSATLTVDGAAPVPEPGTIMLLGLGMAGLAVFSRRRRNKA